MYFAALIALTLPWVILWLVWHHAPWLGVWCIVLFGGITVGAIAYQMSPLVAEVYWTAYGVAIVAIPFWRLLVSIKRHKGPLS